MDYSQLTSFNDFKENGLVLCKENYNKVKPYIIKEYNYKKPYYYHLDTNYNSAIKENRFKFIIINYEQDNILIMFKVIQIMNNKSIKIFDKPISLNSNLMHEKFILDYLITLPFISVVFSENYIDFYKDFKCELSQQDNNYYYDYDIMINKMTNNKWQKNNRVKRIKGNSDFHFFFDTKVNQQDFLNLRLEWESRKQEPCGLNEVKNLLKSEHNTNIKYCGVYYQNKLVCCSVISIDECGIATCLYQYMSTRTDTISILHCIGLIIDCYSLIELNKLGIKRMYMLGANPKHIELLKHKEKNSNGLVLYHKLKIERKNDMSEQKVITYNGKTLKTDFYVEITDKFYQDLKTEYYKKPAFSDVQKQIVNLYNGGTQNNLITDYYYKDLMDKVQVYFNKWSIEDVFNCKELVAHFWAKTQENKNVFPDTMTPIEKIKTAFRLGGKGVATKVSNFPMDTIDKIIRYYNVNDNYYDFSCGWEVRLASALKHNVNYFGTDPNYLLVERLEQYAKDYHKLCFNSSIVDIRCQGSEHFVEQWENKIGLAFSSPPYFYLEDYKIGDQSFKQGTSYQSWLDNYMRPTIKNIYRYLIDNGYFLININNFDKFKLCEDVLNIATSEGFELYCCHTLTNISRCVGSKGKDGVNFNDNNEKIMVFIKKQHKLANEKIGDFETEQGFELSIFDFKEN